MIKAKYLGIWMDNSSAHLMEYSTDAIQTKTIASKFTHEEKTHAMSKSEGLMHNMEQHEQASYYKELGEEIKQYEAVLLFGPTNAKNELFNLLRADHLFEKIKIDVKSADKMSERQQHAFVREYFSKNQLLG